MEPKMDSAAELEVVAEVKTWEDYGLLDLRKIPNHHRLAPPPLLEAGTTHEEALRVLEDALMFKPGDLHIAIDSPVEVVTIKKTNLLHTVEKRLDARERYALYIRPTLIEPYEVWKAQAWDGPRHHYIAAFLGKNDITVTVRIDLDGNMFWNFMQRESRRMNNLRQGELIYSKVKKE
jgi:hypothetical protein